MILPRTMVAGFAYNNALLDPTAGNVNLLSIKSNFIHLIREAYAAYLAKRMNKQRRVALLITWSCAQVLRNMAPSR